MTSTSTTTSSASTKGNGDWNLITLGKQRVMEDLLGSVRATEGNSSSAAKTTWYVLVVDARTLRIVSSCLRMYDVMEENITVVENITKARQPLQSLPAIYLLSPTEESIDALLRDWPAPPGRTMYQRAHVFFCGSLTDVLFKKLAHSTARPFLKTLKELNMDYLSAEPRVFHLDTPQSMWKLYSPDSPGLIDECTSIADRLVTFCVSLKEYPIIRYENSNTTTANDRAVAKGIATALQSKLDELIKHNVYSPNTNLRSILLVVGRTIDPVAPVLSEFTYQAMVNHFLPEVYQNGGRYK